MGGYNGTDDEQQEVSRSYFLRECARVARLKELREAQPLIFAYGRLRLVNAVVSHRHGGPCDTDDGIVYLDLMLPYAVEIAHLKPDADFKGALRRFGYWLPKIVGEMGDAAIGAEWDRLAEERSIARDHNRTESKAGHVLWLPTANQIRDNLRLTGVERDAINATYPQAPPIRGVGVIDPLNAEEKRERDRLRKEASRRANGVRSQASRTQGKDDAVLATALGCATRTIERHRKNRTLTEFVRDRSSRVGNLSTRYIMEEDNGHFSDTADDAMPPVSEAITLLKEIAVDPYGYDALVAP